MVHKILILLIIFISSTVLAAPQDKRAVALFQQLKCPVCKSQSLAASTSFMAEEMKKQIMEFVDDGKTDQQITDYYVARYGDWILMQPKTDGSGVFAWIVPIAGLAIAGLWLGFRLVFWSKPDETLT